MRMETRLALRYSGPAVDTGLMDVYEASANMIAFSEFVELLAKQAFGERVETRASVAGFGRGSFVTDIVFNVAGAHAAIFSTVDPKTLWWMLKEALAVWKSLRGSPPAKVEYRDNTAVVTTNNGQMTTVNIGTLNVVFSENGSAAAQRFVHDALQKDGMDAVEIGMEGEPKERVTQAESQYFIPVTPSEMLTDVVVRMVLQLESPVFKDANKWRFFDGQQSFWALVEDKSFLKSVDAGEAFRKGDTIVADVRIAQQQAGLKLTSDRTIVRVHDHRSRPAQMQLPHSHDD